MKTVYYCALFMLLSITNNAAHGQITFLDESFNSGEIPAGWTLSNTSIGGSAEFGGLGPTASEWTLRENGYTYSSPFLSAVFRSNDASPFFLSNSDAQGDDVPDPTTNTILQMPPINTLGYASLSLRFFHSFWSAGSPDAAMVEASTDGIEWTAVYTATATEVFDIGSPDNFVLEIVNLDAYVGQPILYLRFRYQASFGYYWAIDNVTILGIGGGALPVQLLTFGGYRTGSKNTLTWSTSSEVNNRGFQVERSTDGIHFTTLGFVNSLAVSGNSVNTLRYVYDDLQVGAVKYFYRLRQVDIDGSSRLSSVVHIDATLAQNLFVSSVYPLPVQSVLNIVVSSPVNDQLNISVMDAQGRLVNHRRAAVTRGSNTLQLNTATLPPGQYFLKILSGVDKVFTVEKFLKN